MRRPSANVTYLGVYGKSVMPANASSGVRSSRMARSIAHGSLALGTGPRRPAALAPRRVNCCKRGFDHHERGVSTDAVFNTFREQAARANDGSSDDADLRLQPLDPVEDRTQLAAEHA